MSSGPEQQFVNGGVHSLFIQRNQNCKDIDIYDTHRTNISYLRRDGGVSRRNHDHDGLLKLRGIKRKRLR